MVILFAVPEQLVHANSVSLSNIGASMLLGADGSTTSSSTSKWNNNDFKRRLSSKSPVRATAIVDKVLRMRGGKVISKGKKVRMMVEYES